ncbi:MAG TPA: DNA-processing protein DprA [Acidimicrobiales bacterium]|nr:DNA-processing protein DprA [Acidimicrobiales bacterium]
MLPSRDVPDDEEIIAASLSGLPSLAPALLKAMLNGDRPSSVWRSILAGELPEHLAIDVLLAGKPSSHRSQFASRRESILAKWKHTAEQIEIGQLKQSYRSAGVRVLYQGSTIYPKQFADDPDVPGVLFVKSGCESQSEIPKVALVGTRSATNYGREIAFEMGKSLSEAGVSVLSGLASGIDAAAHRGACSVEGAPPIAVVGSGLDVIYPVSSGPLWHLVGDRGMLVSAYGLGMQPARWHFPLRNRIVAALSNIVVVIESHEAGGAMHTVQAADIRGVPVMAVPGSVRSPASKGTNALLHQGSSVARDTQDVIVLLDLVCPGVRSVCGVLSANNSEDLNAVNRNEESGRESCEPSRIEQARGGYGGRLSEASLRVLEVVNWEPTPTGFIVEQCRDMTIGEITNSLVGLEAEGLARSGDGWWERT